MNVDELSMKCVRAVENLWDAVDVARDHELRERCIGEFIVEVTSILKNGKETLLQIRHRRSEFIDILEYWRKVFLSEIRSLEFRGDIPSKLLSPVLNSGRFLLPAAMILDQQPRLAAFTSLPRGLLEERSKELDHFARIRRRDQAGENKS